MPTSYFLFCSKILVKILSNHPAGFHGRLWREQGQKHFVWSVVWCGARAISFSNAIKIFRFPKSIKLTAAAKKKFSWESTTEFPIEFTMKENFDHFAHIISLEFVSSRTQSHIYYLSALLPSFSESTTKKNKSTDGRIFYKRRSFLPLIIPTTETWRRQPDNNPSRQTSKALFTPQQIC